MNELKKKFVIFDLDGTLIDTLPYIYLASIKYLKDNGYTYTYTQEEVKSFIGKGARNLFSKLVKNTEFKEEEYQTFLEYYEREQYQSKPFEGVVDTLKELEKDYELLIYSNKPDKLLKPLINNEFKDINFLYVQGESKSYPLKPDPTLLNEIIKKYDFCKDFGYYIGDSDVDIKLANNANISSIAVKYGYGDLSKIKESYPTYIIDNFIDIKEILYGRTNEL